MTAMVPFTVLSCVTGKALSRRGLPVDDDLLGGDVEPVQRPLVEQAAGTDQPVRA